MITSYDDITDHTRIFLNEVEVPGDFPARLLSEIFQLPHIWGDGRRTTSPMDLTDLDEAIAEGLAVGSVDHEGRPHPHGALHFDYVGGQRIKVSYHPLGFRDDDGNPTGLGNGLPVVLSKHFDKMHGAGALEKIVRLALT
jgi:hypothetical protein